MGYTNEWGFGSPDTLSWGFGPLGYTSGLGFTPQSPVDMSSKG